MKSAIYPGSFDPVTNGHLNIIRRAAGIFDRLTVCVMVNGAKHPMFSPEERVELLRRVTQDIPNVEIEHSDELLADYARRKQCGVVVKGLRAVSDFEHEFQMALINHQLNPELDTVFFPSSEKYTYLSSTVVREMLRYHADLTEFLPREIIDTVRSKMSEKEAD